MITIDENASMNFSNMGLFVGEKGWTHPHIRTATHEIIFVVKGSAYIEENGVKYALERGDLLLLSPEYAHGGYAESDEISFYWLHFYGVNSERLCQKALRVSDFYSCVSFFAKLNHLAKTGADKAQIECMLAAFLLEKKYSGAEKNKLFYDVREYIRINVASAPKVSDIARHFGYNADYLSRVFIKNCGLSLKKFIDRQRMDCISGLLQTTLMSLKEIAAATGFDDENALIKFFGARSGCSPTAFRNRCYESHTNRM